MRKALIVLTFVAVALLGRVPAASAAPVMFLCISDSAYCDGNYAFLYSDGTTITPQTGGNGVINSSATGPDFASLFGSVGAFSFDWSLGTKDQPGNALDITQNATAAGAGDLYVFFAASGFTGGPYNGTAGGTLSGGITAVNWDACYQNLAGSGVQGALYVCGTEFSPVIGSATFTGASFSGGFESSVMPGSSPFGLMEVLHLTSTGAGTMSGDFALAQVPEPTSMMLLGTGLVGLAAAARRRIKK